VIKALQKLDLAHYVLGVLLVHAFQAHSLDCYSLPGRVV
jgi:hypothetical protein